MSYRSSLNYTVFVWMIAGILIPIFSIHAQTPSDAQKQSLQQQMDALQKDIDGLDQQIDTIHGEKETLSRELAVLDAETKKRELEIKRLSLAIQQADADIKKKDLEVQALDLKIEKIRVNLQENILAYYQQNNASILEALLQYSSLSQYFDSLNSLEHIQAEIQSSLSDLRSTKTSVETARNELQDFKEQQGSLRSLQEQEKQVIDQNKKEKSDLLQQTNGKEAVFQTLLSQKKKNLAELKSQLFYLEKTGVSAEDAVKFAKLAADRAGIRPEFLLALLEVETGKQYADGVITAGSYIGTGNWQTDMYNCYFHLGKRSAAEAQKTAFFEITDALNLDPDKMPVSKKPYYGCGGAIGPAQFLPTTWRLFEERVASLTGHHPANPWNIEDSFTAAALFLADAGAGSKTVGGERQAAQVYISGKALCPSSGSARTACLAYSRKILSLTTDIGQNID